MLTAPFPWFGGKSRVAPLVWERLGEVNNYVEPFAGSLAVLLGRPHPANNETVNDIDAYLCNFWRAVQADPDAVAYWADYPVIEVDLHSRHTWLIQDGKVLVDRLLEDPNFYDARVAGWWVWGICQWIGSGWCAERSTVVRKRPHLANEGIGVHAKRAASYGQPPALSGPGRGIHQASIHQLPYLSEGGRGIHRKKPYLDKGGRGIHKSEHRDGIYAMMAALCQRLRRVRVCCGDWRRVLTPAVTTQLGVTGVLLDPPYGGAAGRCKDLYRVDDLTVAEAVREWAIAHGDDPMLRIALCGYEGEHDDLEARGWEVMAWKTKGGYANANTQGNANAARERIWFSPHCLKPQVGMGPLFEGMASC